MTEHDPLQQANEFITQPIVLGVGAVLLLALFVWLFFLRGSETGRQLGLFINNLFGNALSGLGNVIGRFVGSIIGRVVIITALAFVIVFAADTILLDGAMSSFFQSLFGNSEPTP